MKLDVYAVRDAAVGAFMQPFFARSKGEAIRSFTLAVQDEKHDFYRNPADFALFKLGMWDDTSGELEYSPEFPEKVISALECIKRD